MVLFCHECNAQLRPQATFCDQCGVEVASDARPTVEWVQGGAAKKRSRLKALSAKKLTWVLLAAAVPAIAGAMYVSTPKSLSPDATLARLNEAIEADNEQRLSGYVDSPGMAAAVFRQLFDAAKARDMTGDGLGPVAALTYEGLETRKYEVISGIETKIRQDLFTDTATGKPSKLALVDYQESGEVYEVRDPGARRAKKAKACRVKLRNPATGKTFAFTGAHYLDSKYAWFLERIDVEAGASSPSASYAQELVAFARQSFEVVHREEASKARSALSP